ncbi:MAG: hypothetical protein ACRDIV_10065 [Ktedonobacteraceae bacterium]
MLQFHWSLVKTEGKYEREGMFWLCTETGNFPCPGWRDYPVIKMSVFISEINDIIRKAYITKRYLGFGPYYILIDSAQKDLVTVHFLRSYLPQPLIKLPPVTLPFIAFCRIVLKAGNSMLETYSSRDLGTPMELQSLERAVNSLSFAVSEDHQ